MEGYFLTTKHWKVCLCDDQRYLGYLIIKTLENRQALSHVSAEEQLDFFILIAKLEKFYQEKIGATMFNYSCLMNNAYRDNETPHVHFHFRPRYKSPVTVLGQVFADPNFGEHYLSASLDENGKVSIPMEVKKYIATEMVEYCK